MRTCSVCKGTKETTEFYTCGKYLSSRCKECQKQLSREAWKKAYERDPSKFKNRTKANYASNKDYWKKRQYIWVENNKDKVRLSKRKNESKRRAQRYTTQIEDIDHKMIYDMNNICGICSEPVEWKDFSLDHITPLSKDGPHTIENVQTAHLICNIKKGAR